ncbi:VOC family protein [Lacticaseibacillus sp. GG6-2]
MIESPLLGINHVTAMAKDPEAIYTLMVKILGLHLIKKTVNQDALDTYHLYFTDDQGTAGTDMTFFTFPNQDRAQRGTNMISAVSFRVPNDAALDYWHERLQDRGLQTGTVRQQFDALVLDFTDADGQVYQLISDEHDHGVAGGAPWQHSDVPQEFAIVGLGPVTITIINLAHLDYVLTTVMGFEQIAEAASRRLYSVNAGGHGAQVIVEQNRTLPIAEEGYGMIHHAAFNTVDLTSLKSWVKQIASFRLPQSDLIDRYYFQSNYFRAAPQVLFEIATAGPGFLQDEGYDEAGVKLELPPKLEPRREAIEAGLKPFATDWRGR